MSRNKNAFPWADSGKHQPGMTLREWYAGMAMQAIVSAWADGDWNNADVANEACKQADALIAELAKEEKP